LLDAEEFRNDAGDLAAVRLHGAGECAHHAGRAAAIDEPDTGLREDFAESRGRRHVGRVRSGAGAAIDANLANLTHGGRWQVGSGTVKAPGRGVGRKGNRQTVEKMPADVMLTGPIRPI